MAINVITGLPGSGKSYECVTSVILPALLAGRRVVTNVDGIDGAAIHAYLIEKHGVDAARLGSVIHCQNRHVEDPNFFPHGTEAETFCQSGDLICIDEAWRFFGRDCKILEQQKIFFREHRHFVHPETKTSCDLVLMAQDIGDLHRMLKVVVELSFRTTKLKVVGLNGSYRVEMWESYKQTRAARLKVLNKSYSKDIFPLYSSYVGGAGVEAQVDSRQNIFDKKKTLFLLSFLALGVLCIVYSIRYFTEPKHVAPAPSSLTAAPPTAPTATSLSSSSVPVPIDSPWHIVGRLDLPNESFVVLARPDGSLRLEHPSNFQNSGAVMVGQIDGVRVATWSTRSAP